MSVILDIDMPKTARDCIFNQPAPFRKDCCAINNVCTFPDGCPLHEVPEQKKGEWVLKTLDDGYGEFQLYECSSCGIYTPSRRPFCYNCGAKMVANSVC